MALQAGYEGKLTAFDWQDDIHWPHCLDYLRQVCLVTSQTYLKQEYNRLTEI